MKNITIENWKAVSNYENYQVSDLGNVRSLNYNHSGKIKMLKLGLNKGYLMVVPCKNGKAKPLLVHRLVFSTFNGPIPPGMTVDHINGIKTDNRLSNLQLLTRGDNSRKACDRQLDLIEANQPHTKLTFKSSSEASSFFGYKYKRQVGDLISKARKRGRDWINIRKTKYYFSQET